MTLSTYSDKEWREFIRVDSDGYALEADTVIAERHRVVRQTVWAARKRLKIKSQRSYQIANEPKRDELVTLRFTRQEREAIDTLAGQLHMSISAYVGAVGSMPEAASILASRLGLATSSVLVGVDASPDEVEVGAPEGEFIHAK